LAAFIATRARSPAVSASGATILTRKRDRVELL
jgi:hypothetical protein